MARNTAKAERFDDTGEAVGVFLDTLARAFDFLIDLPPARDVVLGDRLTPAEAIVTDDEIGGRSHDDVGNGDPQERGRHLNVDETEEGEGLCDRRKQKRPELAH